MEFVLMDASVGSRVDEKVEKLKENFTSGGVMPELILPCGCDEYICTAISVKMYRRYTEIMERNDSDSVTDAFEANMQILSEVFGIEYRKMEQAEVEDITAAAKQIHFLMQEVITPKFLNLKYGTSGKSRKGKITI